MLNVPILLYRISVLYELGSAEGGQERWHRTTGMGEREKGGQRSESKVLRR